MKTLLALSVLLTSLSNGSLRPEPDARIDRVHALEAMLDSGDDASLQAFAGAHLTQAYRDSFDGEDALLHHLRELRTAVAPVGGVGLTEDAGRLVLHISNQRGKSRVALEFESEPPFRVTSVVFEGLQPGGPALAFTWETLESELEEAAERDGFCGSILAARGGEVVLERGFGHADSEGRVPVTPQTLFAIGSTPIDFTHGAILFLDDLGELSLSDPITRYFEGVPADKRHITLDHLRTGRSGLLDFPGLPGVDANMDLSWIDRAEFLRRVWASELLFEPGTESRHSHTAWGLLAAVIEVVTGTDYEGFLREVFFEPAKMKRTGHYPHTKRFPASEIAVGLGGNVWGEINAPQYWGETSWLVLGSGGMVSTPGDLYRWHEFLRVGEILSEASRAKYFGNGAIVNEGGNDRGFINTIGARGDDIVIVCSNSHVGMDDATAAVASAASLVGAGE